MKKLINNLNLGLINFRGRFFPIRDSMEVDDVNKI